MFKTNMQGGSFSDVRNRLLAHWQLKLLFLIGLTAAFSVPYIYLAHHPLFRPHDLPTTWFDRVAGFNPKWVWIYQSVYLLTASLPWLAQTRQQLHRYLIGFALLTTMSFAVFVFFPVRSPRELVEHPLGMYAVLMMYDGPYNAMPSLHVGFLFYTLCFARRVRSPLPQFVWMMLICWGVLIAWSTLVTKEHYALDLVVGITFGWISDRAAWSSRLRMSGRTSQSG